jgi:hypothetical protein
MPCRARSAICRLLAGFSLLIPVLGCCIGGGRAVLVCSDGPAQAAGCCPRCGLPHRGLGPARCRPVCSDCSPGAGPNQACGIRGVAPVRGALRAVRGRCHCMFCRLRGLVIGPRGAAGAQTPPEMESPFPRFHPVPRRPALLPSSLGCGAADSAPERETAPREPEEMPTPKPTPAPLPEATPPVSPKPTDGWKPSSRRPLQEAAGASPWMFRPVGSRQPASGTQQSAISSQQSPVGTQESPAD